MRRDPLDRQVNLNEPAGIVVWAAQNRLLATFPTDFPSWWAPGGTTLCVYIPAKEQRTPPDR